MKSLYIFNDTISSSMYGIGTFIRELIHSINKSLFNINLIQFNSNKNEFSITGNDVKYYNIPKFSDNNFFKHHKIIIKILRLHIQDINENIFILNHSPCDHFLKTLNYNYPKSKKIFIIHGQDWCQELLGDKYLLSRIISNKHKSNNKNIQNIISTFKREQEMYNLVDKIVCLSKDTYDIVTNLYSISPQNILVINNGISDSIQGQTKISKQLIKDEYNLDGDEKIILYVGRINREKGIYNLLDSLQKISTKFNKFRLVIAGLPSHLDIFSYASKISSKISFLGYLQKAELYKLYHIADIGVLPSYSEQCSYTGIEMLMHGIPIVTTNGLGNQCMFIHKYNALITNIGNPLNRNQIINSLSKNILKLLYNKNLCNKLSIGARCSYLEKYTITNMINRYTILFNSI